MTDTSSVSSATIAELSMLVKEQEQIVVEAQEKIKAIKNELEG